MASDDAGGAAYVPVICGVVDQIPNNLQCGSLNDRPAGFWSDEVITFDRSDMLILKAEGDLPDQQATWQIDEDRPLLLGRSRDTDCPVPWDPRVSRRHARMMLSGDQLTISCLPQVSNLIWKSGISCMETQLSPGESFRIGQTRFAVSQPQRQATLVEFLDAEAAAMTPTTSMMLNAADVRLAAVSRSAASLWTASSDKLLAEKVTGILRQVMGFADLIVVLSCENISSETRPGVVHWYLRETAAQPTVSRELVSQAVGGNNTAAQVDVDLNGAPTRSGRWAFCVPVRSDAEVPWCLYVGGAFGPASDHSPFLTADKLKPDVVVTELVAHLAGAVRSVRAVESRFEGVQQFFSPQLMEKVSAVGADSASMEPRETDVTVLYCDLRGFSRMVSRASGDLHGLLHRISLALGVMTSTIIDHQGVIADFQGDSALGFWGWPLALTDGPLPACRAALEIQQFFEQSNQESRESLEGFHVGVGIASGRAIAGRIGTRDHAKIGVFGPVVNVASRLEGLTKKTGASILMDAGTATAALQGLESEEGRCRQIGRLLPAGFDEPVEVSELLPPAHCSPISDADIATFRQAEQDFRSGDWDACRKLLARLPAEDRPRDFLLVQIASHGYQPPRDWSGVIPLDSK